MVREIAVDLVDELKAGMPIGEICRHLGIPRSTYYRWRRQKQLEASRQGRQSNEKSARCAGIISFDMATVKSLPY